MAVEDLVKSAITKLQDLAIEEWQIQQGISNDIKFICDELSTMKVVLRVVEKKRVRNELVNQWVAQLRDEAYEIEDVLEEFQSRMESSVIESGEPAGVCLNIEFCIHYVHTFFKQIGIRHQFHSQIESIKKEVHAIYTRRMQYDFPQEGTGPDDEEIRRGDHGVANPFVEEDDIVGIDKDVNKLREWLLKEEEDNRRSIISVVGMGGSGKTTLVKEVYKNISEGKFDCKAWVSVSQDYQEKILLKRLVQKFYESWKKEISGDIEAMELDKLREIIHTDLEGKRYVLVLDDMWDVNAWDVVKNALPRKSGGRIIFTTRDQDVASPIEEISNIHRVEQLPDDLAWSLFCRKAFKSDNLSRGCTGDLKEIGEKIVKRCEGLPLAVVVIGGLMSKKCSNVSKWNNVLENLDWELHNNQDLQRLNRVLLMSYNYLPRFLKYCFLYCGMFPEDYEIKKSRLIRLWVAEGFIEDHPGKTLEEVAHEYLVQLIDRNMLQAVVHEFYEDGLVGCRMHDRMRDIAIHVIKKENFAEIFTKQSNTRIVEGQRRVVAIQNSSDSIPSNTFSAKTRSLLTFDVDKFFPLSVLETIFKSMKRLRVLDLSGTNIEHLPSKVVVQLIHLRYLSVNGTEVNELPDSLYELQNLQTLDARYTSVENFLIYPQLRHLLFNSWSKHVRLSTLGRGSGRGRGRGRGSNSSNLQTLGYVVLDESLVSQLCYLTQLRKFKLYEVKEEYCVRLCDAVEKMQHLRSLSIESSTDEVNILDLETNMSSAPPFHLHLEKLELDGIMKEGHLPQWTRSLKCLQKVELRNSNLMEDPLNTFAQLPNLEVLFLNPESYLGRQIGWGGTSSSSSSNSNEGRQLRFPKLKCLRIDGLPELEELSEIEEGMMPSLKVLLIEDCQKLKKLPHGFQHLKSLHKLEIRFMPEEFIKRLRRYHHHDREGEIVVEGEEEGVDHWMIQHIPTVTAFDRYYNFEAFISQEKHQ